MNHRCEGAWAYTARIRVVTPIHFMPPGAQVQNYPSPVSILVMLVIIILFPVVTGAVGGALAFARAKERLRQRLVLGALAGVLTAWFAWPGVHTNITAFTFLCILGGYAGADGISILLRAIGRGK